MLDPWIDPRTVAVRRLHLQPLADWIAESWPPIRPLRVLDFGCGDLLLARLLRSEYRVDGFDIDASARRAARAAVPAAKVFDSIEDIPERAYDAVVASSVLQYFDGPDAVGSWMGCVARWLRSDGALGAIVTDLPVPGGSRLHDARDLAAVLARELGPLSACRELVRSARRSPGSLLTVGEPVFLGLAMVAGLEARQVDRNLSPFTRRRTYLLTPRAAGLAFEVGCDVGSVADE